MAFTVQNLVDLARRPLNDVDKIRYPDSELLDYANSAYMALRRFRPDLFVGLWGSIPPSLVLGDTFPAVGDEYKHILADYVTARAEFKDDEHVLKERAQAFVQMFNTGIGA